jgi:hypothetical protein
MKTIQAYQTEDGKVFQTEIEAANHEASKALMPEIEEFMISDACKYNNQAHAKICRNTVVAWVLWQARKN